MRGRGRDIVEREQFKEETCAGERVGGGGRGDGEVRLVESVDREEKGKEKRQRKERKNGAEIRVGRISGFQGERGVEESGSKERPIQLRRKNAGKMY